MMHRGDSGARPCKSHGHMLERLEIDSAKGTARRETEVSERISEVGHTILYHWTF